MSPPHRFRIIFFLNYNPQKLYGLSLNERTEGCCNSKLNYPDRISEIEATMVFISVDHCIYFQTVQEMHSGTAIFFCWHSAFIFILQLCKKSYNCYSVCNYRTFNREAFQDTSITGKADNLIEICRDAGKRGFLLDCAM